MPASDLSTPDSRYSRDSQTTSANKKKDVVSVRTQRSAKSCKGSIAQSSAHTAANQRGALKYRRKQ